MLRPAIVFVFPGFSHTSIRSLFFLSLIAGSLWTVPPASSQPLNIEIPKTDDVTTTTPVPPPSIIFQDKGAVLCATATAIQIKNTSIHESESDDMRNSRICNLEEAAVDPVDSGEVTDPKLTTVKSTESSTIAVSTLTSPSSTQSVDSKSSEPATSSSSVNATVEPNSTTPPTRTILPSTTTIAAQSTTAAEISTHTTDPETTPGTTATTFTTNLTTTTRSQSALEENSARATKLVDNGGGMPTGIVALVTMITFAIIAVVAYVSLIAWRRYLEYRYGNRELLVNDLEFDTNDLRHFEL